MNSARDTGGLSGGGPPGIRDNSWEIEQLGSLLTCAEKCSAQMSGPDDLLKTKWTIRYEKSMNSTLNHSGKFALIV